MKTKNKKKRNLQIRYSSFFFFLISSGAGKTVSAKYIMRYFATADDQESTGKRQKMDGLMTEVEEQILGKRLVVVVVKYQGDHYIIQVLTICIYS